MIDLYETDFPGMYMTEDGYYISESGDIYDEDGDLIEEDAVVLEGKMQRKMRRHGKYMSKEGKAAISGGSNLPVTVNSSLATRSADVATRSSGRTFGKVKGVGHKGPVKAHIVGDVSRVSPKQLPPSYTQTIDVTPHGSNVIGNAKNKITGTVHSRNISSNINAMRDRARIANNGGVPKARSGILNYAKNHKGKVALGIAGTAAAAYGLHKAYKHFKNKDDKYDSRKSVGKAKGIDLYETAMPGIYMTEDGYLVDTDGALYDQDGDLIQENAVYFD